METTIEHKKLNTAETTQLGIGAVMPRLFGIYTQDGLVELFWDEKKAEDKIPVYKKDHPYEVFWVEEVAVS